ncbi:T9SS type A sorting domain-containing protein [Aureispira sp. CCB-E]|uniref:T9SS type A sorting domain-containing protein n=1 Tax=Aureispira sp. CCB-E TaxID=3051121 RepID=UPI0028698036|nr:T9SS type A sorting domain-containing protein [Aureispira sp. CCB-E]WMX13644.1 T9SS type A sorting domain-containing protein [Aureispira sp. CCB-E]
MTNTKFITPTTLFFLLFISMNFNAFSQNKIYVNINASGANDGTSWADAFQELQPAINAANAGDSIWVAAGTYYPTLAVDTDNSGSTIDREKTFYISKNITIHGQFQGTETLFSQRNKAHQTILSGDIGLSLDPTDNAFHVVYFDGTTANGPITNSAALDGFIIEQGQASGASFPHNSGAGIFNNGQGMGNGSNPHLNQLIIKHNNADDHGGAIYNDGSQGGAADLLVNASLFEFNGAQYGAVCYNNAASGVININLTHNSYENNTCTEDGAVLYNNADNGYIEATLNNSYFKINMANNGGVCYNNILSSGTASVNFSSNKTSSNQVIKNGGIIYTNNTQGTYNLTAEDNEFETNRAVDGGIFYAIHNNGSSNLNINNNLFNTIEADSSGGIFYNQASNSIVGLNIENNKFTSISSYKSGGVLYNSVDSFSILDLSFSSNTVEGCGSVSGGVIYNTTTNASINHLFEKNFVIFSNGTISSTADGGVIFQEAILGATSYFLSNSNSYISNMVNFRGGAVFNRSDSSWSYTAYINDIFARNSSDNFGGALCNDILNGGVLNTQITNSSFLDQEATIGKSFVAYNQNVGGSAPSITNISNSIFWQSQPTTGPLIHEITTANTLVDLNYSIYFDGNIDNNVILSPDVSGANNLDSDPLFTSTMFGDLTLQNTSPAIDAGNNDSIPSIFNTDNYGSPRINNNTVDMGATEYLNGLITSPQSFYQLPQCNGDSGLVNIILMGGTAPYTINGVPSTMPIGAVIVNDVAGNYQFNVVDANGLSKTVNVNLTEPDPIVLTTAAFSNGSASVTATGGTAPYTYQWDDANQQTSDVATGLTTGTYTVLVTDANGCTQTATVNISVVSSTQTIEMDNKNSLSIFPNPSNGQFSIVFELASEQSLRPTLYNLQGQVVYEFAQKTGQNVNYEANLEHLSAGTYVLSTFISGQQETQFIILK